MSKEKRLREIARLNQFTPMQSDPRAEKRGVLLSNEIEFYVTEGRLIEPFDPDNLKPAAYELTVGDEAMLGGKYYCLGETTKNSQLVIQPFEVVVIKTGETLNIPRFLIGRWNIRVAWAYKGLVWVGGPQVDPGYVGHLFCPIYNLSNKPVRIRKGDPIAVMDFVKTTRLETADGIEDHKLYRHPPKRVIIDDFNIDDFQSALFDQAKLISDELRELRARVNTFTTLVFVVLAILMTVVAIPYIGSEEIKSKIQILDSDILPICLSVFATFIAVFTLWSASKKGRHLWALIGTAAFFSLMAGYVYNMGTWSVLWTLLATLYRSVLLPFGGI